MQYIYVYAIIPEETEIGGFWSFWLRSRPALKDRPRQDCAARLVTRLAVGLADVKTKEHEYAGCSIGEQLLTSIYLQIYKRYIIYGTSTSGSMISRYGSIVLIIAPTI